MTLVVQEAARQGTAAHEVELGLFRRLMSLGHSLFREFLARQGYPIASGVIEGACRHVVKDRLERTGMSWTRRGAQAMLNLRAIWTCDQWDQFETYRIERETARLDPYGQSLSRLEWPVAA